jgi:hypothetical protein
MRISKRDQEVLNEAYLGDVFKRLRGGSKDTPTEDANQSFSIIIGSAEVKNLTLSSLELIPREQRVLLVSLKGDSDVTLWIKEIIERNQYAHPDDIIKSSSKRTSFPTKQDALTFLSSIKSKLKQENIDFNLVGINKLIYLKE